MKTVLFHKHGGPEVLEYIDYPTPSPGLGEVLVKLKCAALNRVDIWVRNGWPGIRLTYPHILGSDGAGEVTALGEGVTSWEIGDKVVINSNFSDGTCKFCIAGQDNMCQNWHLLGETIPGTYAEYISVPSGNLLKLPEGFDERVAAAASLVYHTAWHSLITRGGLRPGETVLIVGGSGGVNSASIQIAKYAGAIVYVVCSSQEKLALAESIGADYLINRSKEGNWSKTVYQMTDKRGVDVVIDNIGTTFPLSFRAASKGGRILTVGNTGGAKFEIDNRYIFGKHLSLIGSTMGTKRDYDTVMNLVFTGKLRPALDKTYPLPDAWIAHERLESGQQLGKITLSIS